MTRVVAALVFTPLMLWFIWLGGAYLAWACLLLAYVMLWEFLQLTLGPHEWFLWAVAYIVGSGLLLTLLGWLPVVSAVVLFPVGIMLLLGVALLRVDEVTTRMPRVAWASLGVLYCCGLIPYLSRLREISLHGLSWAVVALLCTWSADSGAYFTGRWFGTHKLCPKVSPAKTVEGAVGGFLCAVLVGQALRWVLQLPVNAWHLAGISLLAAFCAMVGDLCESLLKRSVGAKDSSQLIPGHGGLLDRFDGALFALPVFYGYAWLLDALAP